MDQKFLAEKAVFRAWIGPTKWDLKVNIDSAFSPTSGPAAVGVMARDNPYIMAWAELLAPFCGKIDGQRIQALWLNQTAPIW
jgi:hypothetical protein